MAQLGHLEYLVSLVKDTSPLEENSGLEEMPASDL